MGLGSTMFIYLKRLLQFLDFCSIIWLYLGYCKFIVLTQFFLKSLSVEALSVDRVCVQGGRGGGRGVTIATSTQVYMKH